MRFVTGPKDRTPENRAEAARRRRSEQAQKRGAGASKRVVNPPKASPVTSRGNLFGSPIHQQAGVRHNRRAFYVTMDQHGSELRLPSLPVFHPGWRLVSGMIFCMALFGIFAIYSSPYFQVTSVNVVGLQRIPVDEITTELNLTNLPIIEIDPGDITRQIAQKYSDLTEVKVSVEVPNFVTISAVERQPVLAWIKEDTTQWIDAEGYIFPARGEVGALVTIKSENDVPLEPRPIEELAETLQARDEEPGQAETAQPGPASGLAQPGEAESSTSDRTPDQANLTLLQAAQALSQKLPPDTLLVYNDLHGLGWTDPQGWQVYIGGDLDQFEEKYLLYQTLASRLVDQGIQPGLVSVEYLNAPFYRVEQ